jgi:hypothetical protein
MPWQGNPLRRITARHEEDQERDGQRFHHVWIALECGHTEELGPGAWHPVRRRRRCWRCGHEARSPFYGWREGDADASSDVRQLDGPYRPTEEGRNETG